MKKKACKIKEYIDAHILHKFGLCFEWSTIHVGLFIFTETGCVVSTSSCR